MRKALKGLLILVVFLAGCGSEGGGGSSTPATGACEITMTNFIGYPSTMCNSGITEASCAQAVDNLRGQGWSSVSYEFHPGKTCADIGY